MMILLSNGKAPNLNSRIATKVLPMREKLLYPSPRTVGDLQSGNLVVKQAEIRSRCFSIHQQKCFANTLFCKMLGIIH